jgi:hypothetical protein
MRKSIALLALAALTAAANQAKADIITTYNVTGTYQDGATMSGTITVDTTTPALLSTDVAVSSPTYGTLNFDSSSPGNYFSQSMPRVGGSPDSFVLVDIQPNGNGNATTMLQFVAEAPGFVWPSGIVTLVNRTESFIDGSQVSTFYNPDADPSLGGADQVYLSSGELDPVNTPEPATLTMLASGFVALGGFGFSRRRRRASH